MTTHSDRLAPLRAFLKAHGADPGIPLEPGETEIEKWEIDGRPLLVLKNANGAWGAYTPIAFSDTGDERQALERYLLGARPDLDILADMERLSRAFLAKLDDAPACSDLNCGQAVCKDTRAIRFAVESFLTKLQPRKPSKEIANARPA